MASLLKSMMAAAADSDSSEEDEDLQVQQQQKQPQQLIKKHGQTAPPAPAPTSGLIPKLAPSDGNAGLPPAGQSYSADGAASASSYGGAYPSASSSYDPLMAKPASMSGQYQQYLQQQGMADEATSAASLDRFYLTISVEFTDASQAVTEHPWNASAWQILMEEAEAGRGGPDADIVDIYKRFLDQFPRTASVWKSLTDRYLERNEFQLADDAFKACLSRCRHVDLWLSYIRTVKQKTVDKMSKFSENYPNAKKVLETAFEKALENVGLMHDSHPVWRAYLEFVKDWPEANAVDAGVKLSTLRGLYQRAVCVPSDDLDLFWRDYEALETTKGEHLAEQLLPDFRAKYQHAKAVHRERKRLTAKIIFDRVSTPPSKSLTELQQLDLWNKWIKYELSNPCNLDASQHRLYMRAVFDRSLCCHRHHPEVWMALARFELSAGSGSNTDAVRVPGTEAGGLAEAKAVLREALDCNAQVASLRIALAELEEEGGDVDAAKDTLRAAFAAMPSGFTFSVMQRLVRRTEGIVAARKCFSDTMSLRCDGSLDHEIFIAHANLELTVNGEPSVALRAMELARRQNPEASSDVAFVLLTVRILQRLGDLNQIRWVFQSVLGESIEAENNKKKTSTTETSVTDVKTLVAKVQLWEEYFKAELALGMCNLKRLNELRDKIVKARAALPAGTKVPELESKGMLSDALASGAGMFEYPTLLFEKYVIGGVSLPEQDAMLRDRCRGSSYIDEIVRTAEQEQSAIDNQSRRKWGRHSRDSSHVAAEIADSLLAGTPAAFKEFLAKLPALPGTEQPDIDAFVDILRRAVLPPRPADDSTGDDEQQLLGKRGRDDTFAWDGTAGGAADEGDGGAEESAVLALEARDDVFKRRQRARLAAGDN